MPPSLFEPKAQDKGTNAQGALESNNGYHKLLYHTSSWAHYMWPVTLDIISLRNRDQEVIFSHTLREGNLVTEFFFSQVGILKGSFPSRINADGT
jgi:hypothetical protein